MLIVSIMYKRRYQIILQHLYSWYHIDAECAKDKNETYSHSERQNFLPQMKDELKRTKLHSLGYRSNTFNQGFRTSQTQGKHLSLCPSYQFLFIFPFLRFLKPIWSSNWIKVILFLKSTKKPKVIVKEKGAMMMYQILNSRT